jgi:hypothetical protein
LADPRGFGRAALSASAKIVAVTRHESYTIWFIVCDALHLGRQDMKSISAAFLVAFLAGCASSAETEAERWGWLQPGQTRLEDVLFSFGTPNSIYDNERTLVYKVYYAPLQPGRDLVLLFDEKGLLRSYKTAEPLR